LFASIGTSGIGAEAFGATFGFVFPRSLRYSCCMLKSDEYRDFDFWVLGFLVVVDLVLFLVFDLGEDEGFDGVGFLIVLNEG
jgi:hypothetical protein